jgi:integrase
MVSLLTTLAACLLCARKRASDQLSLVLPEIPEPIWNLGHCSFHGLRKAASVRLAEAGCTPHEIAAMTVHASLKEIVRYTQTADRKRLAAAAMEKVKTETSSVKPDARFDKKREKL